MAILKSKSGYSYDTETGAKTTPTIQPNNLVGIDTLQGSGTKLEIPVLSPYSFGGLEGAMEGLTTQNQTQADLQAKAETEKKSSNKVLDELYASLGVTNTALGNVSSSVSREEQDAARKKFDEYTSQLEQEQLANRRRLERLQKENPEGLFGGGLEQELSRLNRESLSKQADIAILQTAANRNYETAASIADRQVQMNLEALTARAKNIEMFINRNQAIFDKADERAFQLAKSRIDQELKTKTDNENAIRDMKLSVAQSQDPNKSSILASLSQIDTSKPEAFNQAMTLLGQVKDPMVQLDLALKRQQLATAQKQYQLLGEPTPTEKKKEAEALKSQQGQTDTLKEKVNLIDSILESKGLASRVGTTPFTRKGLLNVSLIADVTGQGQQFAGGVHKLASREFLDALIGAKAQGATFGALTDREGDALRAAATQLNDWELKDKNGLGRGIWNIDEQSFKKELNNLKRLANLGIMRANGTAFEQDEQSLLDNLFSPDNMALDPANYY